MWTDDVHSGPELHRRPGATQCFVNKANPDGGRRVVGTLALCISKPGGQK
jgi:hypothetical protein